MQALAIEKINRIRRHFIAGPFNGAALARELQVQADTVYHYIHEFRQIAQRYPHKLKDFTFRMPRKKAGGKRDARYEELLAALPAIIEQSRTPVLESLNLWQDYRRSHPRGYSLSRFRMYYNEWRHQNNICRYHHRHIKQMPPEDQAELACWRNEDDTRRWQKAVVLLGSYQHRTIEELSRQTEISQESILQWIASYKCSGLSRLRTPMRPPNRFEAANQQKRENLLRLIQQRPAVFGINRASWKIADLSSVYQRVYGTPLSGHPIRDHLKKMGYKFEKSRQRLISPDPDFSAKVERIKTILSRLGPDEKFFSIDEYGPVNIRLKTGWSLTPRGAVRLIPEFQKSKGSFIMTAALELSTNQITHFYSASKDSREIIRLIDLLVAQYRGHKNIYLSWDAAGWHCSNSLKAHLQHINHKNYRLRQGTAAVGVVPLPSYAPYLNVIESVFSGMAKAVIHNGDYASVAECQAAIDRYFQERNAYYRANPQKAGKKIWGREIVPPVFDEFQNCKNRLKKDKDAR